jgi:hypothetical protein
VKEVDYPEDFVQRVMKEYDNDPKLAALIEEGSPGLGFFLDAFSQRNISPQEILDAIDSGDTAELRSKAASLVCRRDLYGEWHRLYGTQDKT